MRSNIARTPSAGRRPEAALMWPARSCWWMPGARAASQARTQGAPALSAWARLRTPHGAVLSRARRRRTRPGGSHAPPLHELDVQADQVDRAADDEVDEIVHALRSVVEARREEEHRRARLL